MKPADPKASTLQRGSHGGGIGGGDSDDDSNRVSGTRRSLDVIDLPIKVRPSRARVLSSYRRRHFQRQEGYECDECSRTKQLHSGNDQSNARTNHLNSLTTFG